MIKKIAKFELRCDQHGHSLTDLCLAMAHITIIFMAFLEVLLIFCAPGIIWYNISFPCSQEKILKAAAFSCFCWMAAIVIISVIIGMVLLAIHVHRKIRRTKKEIIG